MSTFSERPDSEQAQRSFFANAHLPLGLVEAATLLGYWTMRDAEDRDVPAAAALWMKRHTDFYLGAILMELALHGRLHMDRTTPLENHAYWYERRQPLSWKGLWLLVPPPALFLACLIAFQHAQQRLAVLFLLGFIAYILLMLLLAVVRGLLSRGKSAQGKLEVVDPTPTGNHVLDAILWQMLSTGQSRQVYQWLYGSGALRADGLYAFSERRLAEHGWITLTGKQPALGGAVRGGDPGDQSPERTMAGAEQSAPLCALAGRFLVARNGRTVALTDRVYAHVPHTSPAPLPRSTPAENRERPLPGPLLPRGDHDRAPKAPGANAGGSGNSSSYWRTALRYPLKYPQWDRAQCRI